PNFKQVTVYHSWKDNIPLAIYYLVKDSSIATPSDGTKIKIPLQSLGITSCTHVEFLHLLDELSSVKGSTSPEIIYNEILQRKYKENQLVHLGDAFRIDFERLLLLNPDALMITSYNSSADENTRRLQNAGVNLIYNQEWTEETLLGRAEWIKFVASFYDKDLLADSLFNRIEENYQKAKSLANSAEEKPDILAGGNFKGTWYMPSGKVFMGKLFLDAGGRYYYADDTSKGSLPLSFETVLLHQQHADVWLNAQAESLQELIAQDERHRLFDAVKNKQVYNFNARMKEKGANDFWESGVARPDRILSDVIWALHPELLPDYQPFYIQKLK
ncbi:MAG: ABC transporter substrate-binding protein, partial [Bacteroidales bacterium]|nr:ABC transporter substrate-binding protein [Bacteroidales bacterium]